MKFYLRYVAIVPLLSALAVSCSHKKMEKPDPEAMDNLFEKYFGKSLQDFQNRKVYTELNPEILATIPDEELEQAIRDFTALKIDHDWANDVERVPALGPGFSAVYFLSIMDAEVNNGGFNQFFYNCGRRAVLHAKNAADLLGLADLADVIVKALESRRLRETRWTELKRLGHLRRFLTPTMTCPLKLPIISSKGWTLISRRR
jgi:hypothetical protein